MTTTPDEEARPRTRGDCERGPRPCPRISCRYHLAHVELGARGELIVAGRRLSADGDERAIDDVVELVLAMPQTCALDVIARNPDGMTLDEVGKIFGVTRERVRQIERKAIERLPRRIRRRLGSAAREASSAAPATAGIPLDVESDV